MIPPQLPEELHKLKLKEAETTTKIQMTPPQLPEEPNKLLLKLAQTTT